MEFHDPAEPYDNIILLLRSIQLKTNMPAQIFYVPICLLSLSEIVKDELMHSQHLNDLTEQFKN